MILNKDKDILKYIDMKADTGSEYLFFSKKKAYADDTLSVF